MLCSLVELERADHPDDCRGEVRILGVAQHPISTRQRQRHELDRRNPEKDVASRLALLLVLDHQIARAGDALHGAVRIRPRSHSEDRRDGADEQECRRRRIGESQPTGERDDPKRETDEQHRHHEVNDLGMQLRDIGHEDGLANGGARRFVVLNEVKDLHARALMNRKSSEDRE